MSSETTPPPAQPPEATCIIDRFHTNPDAFVVDGGYGCDVPCKAGGDRLTQPCGRTVIPRIGETGLKELQADPASPRCAESAGTVVRIRPPEKGINPNLL